MRPSFMIYLLAVCSAASARRHVDVAPLSAISGRGGPGEVTTFTHGDCVLGLCKASGLESRWRSMAVGVSACTAKSFFAAHVNRGTVWTDNVSEGWPDLGDCTVPLACCLACRPLPKQGLDAGIEPTRLNETCLGLYEDDAPAPHVASSMAALVFCICVVISMIKDMARDAGFCIGLRSDHKPVRRPAIDDEDQRLEQRRHVEASTDLVDEEDSDDEEWMQIRLLLNEKSIAQLRLLAAAIRGSNQGLKRMTHDQLVERITVDIASGMLDIMCQRLPGNTDVFRGNPVCLDETLNFQRRLVCWINMRVPFDD